MVAIVTRSRNPHRRKIEHRKHGTSALAKALRAHGLEGLDNRMPLVREARQWAADYAVDQGGEESLGVGYLELLKLATVKHVMAEHVAGILMAKPAWIVNRRRRHVSQLAKDYVMLSRALREDLVALGLERAPKPVASLEQLLSAAQAQEEAEQAAAAAQAVEAQPEPEAVQGGEPVEKPTDEQGEEER